MTVTEAPGGARPRWLLAVLCLGLLARVPASCSDSSPSRPDADTSTPDAGGPSLPAGLNLQGPLFALDTETPIYTFDVSEDTEHVLQGVLTDAAGRRELRYASLADGSYEVVAAADFNLPPVGARAADGRVAVCFNRLLGAPSALTDAAMPDPTQGVALGCRIRAGGGAWGPLIAVGTESVAAWAVEVTAEPDGSFGFDYYRDDGWFVPVRDPAGGLFRQTLVGGALSEPVAIGTGGSF